MTQTATAPNPTQQGAKDDYYHATSQRDKTNPFLIAATPLLTLMTQFKQTQTQPDVAKLREQVVNELKIFETKLVKLRYDQRTVTAARYCLCAALDEAALKTQWGTQSIWVQQSLLSLFHKETWGGERFYVILDSLAREPRRHLAVLELLYVLMSLGFEGKYFDKGRVMRDEIRNRVFERIRHARGKVEKSLSLNWQDTKPLVQNKRKRATLKRVVLAGVLFLAVIVGIYNVKSHKAAADVLATLDSIGQENPVTAYSQLLDRPIIPHKFD